MPNFDENSKFNNSKKFKVETDTEKKKEFVFIYSPYNGFAIAVNHYIDMGYETTGSPICVEQHGVLTFFQAMELNNFESYKQDMLEELKETEKQLEENKAGVMKLREYLINERKRNKEASSSFFGFLKFLFSKKDK